MVQTVGSLFSVRYYSKRGRTIYVITVGTVQSQDLGEEEGIEEFSASVFAEVFRLIITYVWRLSLGWSPNSRTWGGLLAFY